VAVVPWASPFASAPGQWPFSALDIVGPVGRNDTHAIDGRRGPWHREVVGWCVGVVEIVAPVGTERTIESIGRKEETPHKNS